MKRRVFLSLGILGAVALAGVILIAWSTAPRNLTTMERIAKVEQGMTEAEVIAVLGSNGASGRFSKALSTVTELDVLVSVHYVHQKRFPEWSERKMSVFPGAVLDSMQWKEWQTREDHVTVIGFDDAGRVAAIVSYRVSGDWSSIIRRWFGLT